MKLDNECDVAMLSSLANDEDMPPAESPFAVVRQINGELLDMEPEIIMHDETFVLRWEERHPEMTRAREYFGKSEDETLTRSEIAK
jgi:hypothetical protein